MNSHPTPGPAVGLPQEQLLSALVAGSNDAIISKALDGTIMSWNPAAERMFGYTATEILGRPITTLIPPERHPEEARIIERLRAGERIERLETVRVRKDGRLIDVSLTISPIQDQRGTIIGASKIARDITERKRAEERLKHCYEELEALVARRTTELRESLEELETFSSCLPHDLKGPLRSICSFLRLLREDHGAELSAGGQALVGRLEGSCSRLLGLVDEVLTYARMRASVVALEDIDPAEVVRCVLEAEMQAMGDQAQVSIAEPLQPVRANSGLLQQAVANLMSNAVKFVAPGTLPAIKLWTERRGRKVRLWVEDNGIGIAERDQERVFTLFERLHSQATYPGTGVGLAVVHRAVAKMGGTSGVESQVGKGSRFWIELPVAEAAGGSGAGELQVS